MTLMKTGSAITRALRAAHLRSRRVVRVVPVLSALLCLHCAFGASIDPAIIDNPRGVVLDRASDSRWQALFRPNPRWLARQIAFLEGHQPDQLLTLLTARLLYRGEPWNRRNTDATAAVLWKQTNSDVRGAILRALRPYRDPVLGDYLCQYLAAEDDPALVASALIDLYLIDPPSGPTWAIRLADPRNTLHLPGAANLAVREWCLTFLMQTIGIDAPETRQALDWALLRVSGRERNHAIALIPHGAAPELLTAVILRLAAEFHNGILDDEGKLGLVLATTRLTGAADRDLVVALMDLAVHADRAVAASAATALSSNLSWDVPVAINDLAARAQKDADPVVRQSLMAFLMRLYPSAVPAAAGADSPWTELANHQERLQEWEWERAVK